MMTFFVIVLMAASVVPGVYLKDDLLDCSVNPVYFTVAAKDLPQAGGFSVGNKSEEVVGKYDDPDCKLEVYVDDVKKHTTRAITSRSPTWGECFQLTVGVNIRFEVWDEDPAGNPDDHIATANTNFGELMRMPHGSKKTLDTSSSYGDGELHIFRCPSLDACCPPDESCSVNKVTL